MMACTGRTVWATRKESKRPVSLPTSMHRGRVPSLNFTSHQLGLLPTRRGYPLKKFIFARRGKRSGGFRGPELWCSPSGRTLNPSRQSPRSHTSPGALPRPSDPGMIPSPSTRGKSTGIIFYCLTWMSSTGSSKRVVCLFRSPRPNSRTRLKTLALVQNRLQLINDCLIKFWLN